ncbi:MAG: TlpA family protein disulfide reductase [Phycisphaerales bacterium]|nr:MAG: TlpA family protein disulfide reductase [Phycisphaerales bacterium]
MNGNRQRILRGVVAFNWVRGVLAGVASVSIVGGAWAQPTADAEASPEPMALPATTPGTASDSSVLSGDVARAKGILERAASVLENTSSLAFSVEYTPSALVASMMKGSSGDVRMLRTSESGDSTWIVSVSGAEAGTPLDQGFNATWLERTAEWIDHSDRKLIEKPTRSARGTTLQAAKTLRLEDIMTARPFDKFLNSGATSYGLLEPETIDGVACEGVWMRSGARGAKMMWWFGTEDGLPRRSKKAVGDGDDAFTWNLRSVRATSVSESPAFTRESLRVALPEGYGEDRTAAPAINPVEAKPPRPSPGKPLVTDARPVEIVEGTKSADSGMPAPLPPPPEIRLPEFSLTRVGSGEKVTRESLSGKVAILDFFGSWCVSSRDWHATLKTILDEHSGVAGATGGGEGLVVYGVLVRQRDPADASAIVESAGLAGAMPLLEAGESLANACGVFTYPGVAIVSRDGTVTPINAAHKDGSRAAIDAAIRTALGLAPREAAAGETPAANEKKEEPEPIEGEKKD